MKTIKKIAVGLSCVFVMAMATACGGDGGSDEIELLVDLHSLNPSLNSTPTAENPDVVLSTKYIIDAFEEENPGITVRIDRSKDVAADEDGVSEWFVNKINNGNCPVIAFSWGTTFQTRDYYVDLTEYLEEPNEYVEGNERWADQFYDYVWDDTNVADVNGKIVSIPLLLAPGTETAYYYNTELISQDSLPMNWEEFIDTAHALEDSGVVGFAQWGNATKVTLDTWSFKFSIGPSFIGGQMDILDYDQDGNISTYEQLRGVKEGKYNPVTNDYAKEVFLQAKRYFTTTGSEENRGPLNKNWQGSSFYNTWSAGGVGMLEDGTWSINKENNNVDREFEYGMMAPPLLDTSTSEYALPEIEYVTGEELEYKVNYSLNIMKPAVEGKPELLEAAVKFLKFLSTTDCLSMIIEENGSYIGATKDSGHSSILDSYLSAQFPVVPNGMWPLGFTSEYNDAINRLFQKWYLGDIDDAEFYEGLNTNQQAGADAMIASMEIDTTGWDL